MITLALLAALAAPQTPPTPREAQAATSTRLRAIIAERQLFAAWEKAWSRSEQERRPSYYQFDQSLVSDLLQGGVKSDPREPDLKCAFGPDSPPVYIPDHAWGISPKERRIGGRENNRQWVCPNWLPPADYYLSGPHLPDERAGIDGALEPGYRASIAAMRSDVIAMLETAVRANPTDALLVGQQIRLLVDQGALDLAQDRVQACHAERWWCDALAGYVYHRLNEISVADTKYRDAIAAMPDSTRCAWTDVSPLIDHDARSSYSRTSCHERDAINATLWWLADPLWSEAGNDRRVEQFSRQMTIALHSALARDERYNWTPFQGGDALAEMISRYGWPSYTYGKGSPVTLPPTPPPSYGYVLLFQPAPKGPPLPDPNESKRAMAGLKTTFEYSIGRVHVVPPWSMITDPFAIKNSDWSMNAPGGEWDFTMKWWPQEHYAPAHPLTGFLDQQTAHLRRQDSTLYAYATNLSQTELKRQPGDTVDAGFVWSTGPDEVMVAARKRAGAFDRLVFLHTVPLQPSLVSIEAMWDKDGRYAGRSRFGITPPKPLSGMQPGTAAISDPVLLQVPIGASALPNDAESAIAFMLGSTTLSPATTSLGVYWETYGYSARDTVEVSVTVQRTSALSLLRNLAVAAGVASNSNAPVSASWKEPQPGHDTRTIGGAVPIQMRSIILNISTLEAGEYTLEVAVGKPGGAAVKSQREFVIR